MTGPGDAGTIRPLRDRREVWSELNARAVADVPRALVCLAALALLWASAQPRASQSPPAVTTASLTLRIIIVSTPDEAQHVVDALRAGESFAALAKRMSIDPSAEQGGLLGTIDPSGLRPELRRALEGLSPGQITAIVAVPTGFAVLKVVPRDEVDETSSTVRA
jgi:parvulin-like peptidyl-prolyl isomerase